MIARKIPELLSPAGGIQQLEAAVQNGADAVYMGGPFFNARIKAENFTDDDMLRAIDYAHERNVKIYVTLNTLIRDDELYRAFSYVDFLYSAGADALIVQDIGLSRLVRRYFPDFPLHLSTQGTLYNRQGVETAKELGFSRVVPARELSLEEIREVSDECHSGKTSCEVEVFVHGALCMCYSGQCQMSRMLGGANGRSGNRGLCAQPCRLPYENDRGEKGYFLSPKDICYIGSIGELCEAGVDSFKIEGRLKSPQYVAVVTSIYRKYMDMYAQTGRADVSDEDMNKLLQIFNRGGFTQKYLRGNPKENILSGESPKNRGVFIGTVTAGQENEMRKGGSSALSRKLIDVKLEGKLSIGDGVEIRGSNVAGNVVTYIKEFSGGIVRIGDIKEKVKKGDKIYKVTDKELLKAAEETYSRGERRKSAIDMVFKASIGSVPELEIVDREGDISVTVEGSGITGRATEKATDENKIKAQLSKLGSTPFSPGRIDVQTEGMPFIPASEINDMRRRGAGAIMEMRCEAVRKGRKSIGRDKLEEAAMKEGIYSRRDNEADEKDIQEYFSVSHAPDKKAFKYIPIEIYMEKDSEENTDDIPYVFNVSKGKLDSYIEENFNNIVKRVCDRGIMLNNIGWIKEFRDEGIKIFGGSGLNAYNMQSVKAYEEIGVEVVQPSCEMVKEENIPLMITECDLGTSILIDRKGVTYDVFNAFSDDKKIIKKREEKDR